MRPIGTEIGDPGLRLLRDDAPVQHLTKAQRLRIRFWAWLTDRAERQWLIANGWKEREPGWWFLPDWHPKKLRLQAEQSGRSRRRRSRYDDDERSKEPYDQNHAANSQRFYIRAVQTPRPQRQKARMRYDRLFHISVTAHGFSMMCGALGGGIYGTHGLNWVSGLFFLAAALTLGVSLFVGRAARLELEMNYVEERLQRAPWNSNQAGR